ncbi:50S ribosomal protein L10 [Methanobrevibacter filiformis]|uniref:Large ribosomal subunit protein uL10 n=1 Tax=Methanobrevibacter filiformis TaxID=55758 RepID=A0A166C5I6_9EURY|nr:50S ribosomal protein L10 [Methanobrevibacter filiformis]KZX11427.1 50S ribosomal protein L10 [Methanobrevibacter filiformis]
MAHIAEWKKDEVRDLKDLINSHDVIGIVDLLNIPSRQMQKMRQSLKDKALIRMSKKNLMELAFKESNKEKVIELSPFMEGQPAIVFTELNPFRLYKILEDSKTAAPAKAGSTAGSDIIVPAGDTGFEPGPFLGELQQVGVPAKIDKGKIVINKDHVIVKAGEVVSREVASTLTRLDILPMEVGIDLRAVFEEESIYTSDVLTIDEEQTLANVRAAFTGAFNLSVNAAIPTTKTISAIIGNAHSKAFNLGVNAAIVTDETTDVLLALAQSQLLAIASAISGSEDALSEKVSDLLANRPTAAVAAPSDAPKEEVVEEEEEEEATEEEAAAGLGALFG